MVKTVYRSPRFDVQEVMATANGKRFKLSKIIYRNGAIVVPVLENGDIVLEKQYRHSIKKWMFELPAGMVEKGESPKATAARELREETGYRAKRLQFLFESAQDPEHGKGVWYFYLATGLVKGRKELEEQEMIQVFTVTLDKALSMVDRNVIKDGKTIEGILYYYRKYRLGIN
jgi:ADP-ribose pyrophosphatase